MQMMVRTARERLTAEVGSSPKERHPVSDVRLPDEQHRAVVGADEVTDEARSIINIY